MNSVEHFEDFLSGTASAVPGLDVFTQEIERCPHPETVRFVNRAQGVLQRFPGHKTKSGLSENPEAKDEVLEAFATGQKEQERAHLSCGDECQEPGAASAPNACRQILSDPAGSPGKFLVSSGPGGIRFRRHGDRPLTPASIRHNIGTSYDRPNFSFTQCCVVSQNFDAAPYLRRTISAHDPGSRRRRRPECQGGGAERRGDGI